jgi:hypothetical protein
VLQKVNSDVTSVMTWDLQNNVEDRNFEIRCKRDLDVVSGVNSNLNYFIEGNNLIDLEYNFPLKFYDQNINRFRPDFMERAISEGKDLVLI